jgi:hypothetical protein
MAKEVEADPIFAELKQQFDALFAEASPDAQLIAMAITNHAIFTARAMAISFDAEQPDWENQNDLNSLLRKIERHLHAIAYAAVCKANNVDPAETLKTAMSALEPKP